MAAAAAERLRVVRDQRPVLQVTGQGGEVRRVAGDRPFAVGSGPAPALDGERDRAAGQVGRGARSRRHLDRLVDGAARDLALVLVLQPLDHGTQLELRCEVPQPREVGAGGLGAQHLFRYVDVQLHGRELLRDPRVVGVLGQVLLPLGARDLVDRVEHLLERTELLQQLGSGLVADARNAGDVVRRVALEPDQVGDQLRSHAVALDDALGVVDLGVRDAARRRHHPHPIANQLVHITIAGDDHHRCAGLTGLPRQGGDHVVRLEALDVDVGEAERLRQRRQVRPLLAQQVRPRAAARLVLRVLRVAARHPAVPRHDHGARPVVDQELGHHRGEAVDRVGRPPVGRRDRLGQREERPVRERVAVDQEDLSVDGLRLRLGHGLILCTADPAPRVDAEQPRQPVAVGRHPPVPAIGRPGESPEQRRERPAGRKQRDQRGRAGAT